VRDDTTTYFNTATDGFVLIDRAGRILDVNRAYCRMLGYTREELLLKRLADIEARESEEQTLDHLKRIMTSGYDRFVSSQRRRDGTILDVDFLVRYQEIHGGIYLTVVRKIPNDGARIGEAGTEAE